MFRIFTTITALCVAAGLSAQSFSEDIRVNQEGYFADGKKLISVVTGSSGTYELKSPGRDTTYHSGSFGAPSNWSYSNEDIATIDITSFSVPGNYVIEIPGIGYSHTFTIFNRIGMDVLTKTLKAYYFMRSGTAITQEHGGKWQRAGGHWDTAAVIHSSAASPAYPQGSTVSSPRGWYDAGDYNKYIVNSGISTYTLLAAYEHYPVIFDSLKTNIPETGNSIPDILDEALWNIRWMLTMQDTADGGVWHKLTNANFDGIVMPANGQNNPRYIVMKSTAATLDFAAVMAVAHRVYQPLMPAFADSCLQAAEEAWVWAQANPAVYYNQNSMNSSHNPNISTGEYGDSDVEDEFLWAASELYIATDDDAYYNEVSGSSVNWFAVPGWPNVATLGMYSLAHHRKNLTAAGTADTATFKNRIIQKANDLRDYYQNSAHRVTMGDESWDFVWGSNGTAGNQGMLLMLAYELTGNSDYLDAATGSFDYLLGRNATNYSFVTGLGDKQPMNPHHRPSDADNVTEPVPGMVVGGPHDQNSGDCNSYPHSEPAKRYLDDWCSYSTNEITINWNAPMVYLSAALQDHFLAGDYGSFDLKEDKASHEIKIFPNPTAGQIFISLSGESQNAEVRVYDIVGNLVLSESYDDVGSLELDLPGPQGIYLVRVFGEEFSSVMKVVKR